MNIQKISLRDVVFSGFHGVTDGERAAMQRFEVAVTLLFNAAPSINSERLDDTIDYFDVIKLIRRHIENGHKKHVLLETLVDDIVNDIAKTFSCFRVDLSVRKLDVPFCPKIEVVKNYFSRAAVPIPSFEYIHQELITHGAVSIPFLTDEERIRLLDSAKKLEYSKQPEQPFGGVVREELSSCSVKDEGSDFFAIADRVALFLTELCQITGQGSPYFPKPHVAVQKYDAGSIGITPHRDEKKYGLVIAILPLIGKGNLATCDDRAGNNPVAIDTTLGNLVLLRAPGYAGMHVRPMHTINTITEERIVLGIRFATNE